MTQLVSDHIINLADVPTTPIALEKLESILANGSYSNSSISISFGKLVFTQGHMARLRSFTQKHNIKIELIYAAAGPTQLACLSSGFLVTEKPLESLVNIKETKHNEVEQTPTKQVVKQVVNPTTINNKLDVTEKDINDVEEFLNMDDQMVQHKVNLPFEPKVNLGDAQTNKSSDLKTLYINNTLRSGQIVAYNGNIIIAGDTHPGSEIIASGDIIVWGTLGGVAHAGTGNNYKASIKALKMNPIQLRIADYIARRPDFRRELNHKLPIKPEVARISGGEIRIFSLK